MNAASTLTARSRISASKADRTTMLLVENESGNKSLFEQIAGKLGTDCDIRRMNNTSSALESLHKKKVDLVLLDSRLPAVEAIKFLNGIADLLQDMSIDMTTVVVGWKNDSLGREWIQRGADDFVPADELSPQRIDVIMAKALRARRLRRENAHILEQLRNTGQEFDHFVRALSHDMVANFMLLESSFSQLRSNLEPAPETESGKMFAHADACLQESKCFLDDLVQLAKTGSVEMEPEEVDLDKIVAEVLFEQGELLTQDGIEVDVAPHLAAVWCNRQRVKQVVTNLVRNAIKHGCDPSCPQITISSQSREDRVLLRIHDNGIGIESRMHKEIFLPGRRLPTASEEGSGMGLAIVRKIAEHYGGAAWVDAQTTVGTAIIVSLPALPDGSILSRDKTGSDRHSQPEQGPTADLHSPHDRPSTKHR
ncbi:MAG: hybrid sensor histidine kinase/response regulator [Pirellulales bacterium]|nr:hybrid sensor histidine kinase/response regulator [Pirellulales bacterium]